MKVIIYNINQEDKKLLALANRKKHKITIITSPLDETTVYFADSKDAVIITDHISPEIIELLSSLNIKYLLFDSDELSPAETSLIKNKGFTFIQIKNSDQKPKAFQIIDTLDEWEKSDKDHSERK